MEGFGSVWRMIASDLVLSTGRVCKSSVNFIARDQGFEDLWPESRIAIELRMIVIRPVVVTAVAVG